MSTYQTSDYDWDNEYDWERIQYTITDGVVTNTRTLFDAGYEVFGTYEDGILTSEWYSGSTATMGFEYGSIDYDENGQITDRFKAYENELRISEDFADGVRTLTTIKDAFFGPGVEDWASIELTHGADGKITSRTVTMDDGTILTDTYTSGVNALTYDIANTKNWESIETTFDGDGALATKTFTYDNGIVRTDSYENGTRTEMTRVDTDDVAKWSTHTNVYEDGQLTQRWQVRDNGDVSVTLFEDGKRSMVINHDVDGNNAWLIRTIEYDADGGKTVTKYNSAEDLPSAVLDLFPDLAPPKTELVLDFNDGVKIYDGDEILDGTFIVNTTELEFGGNGIVFPNEYGGPDADADKEAFNSWGSTVTISAVGVDEFDFDSVSLGNASKEDTTYIPEANWANEVTINGYLDGVLVETAVIDLTFEHVTHELDWTGLDQIEFVATGGGITNDFVTNAGWFSMDDLTFGV